MRERYPGEAAVKAARAAYDAADARLTELLASPDAATEAAEQLAEELEQAERALEIAEASADVATGATVN